MMVEAKVQSITSTQDGRVYVHMFSQETGKYFSEDGTEAILAVYGKKVQPRKIAKYLKKKLLSKVIRLYVRNGNVEEFDENLRKAIIAA